MEKSKFDFISLLKAFSRGIKPIVDTDTNWQEIYSLSVKHNVTGIITNEIMMLPKEYRPDQTTMSHFRQILGYTLLGADKKDKMEEESDKALVDAKIMHAFLKGSDIKMYYSVPELRTSGDIDIYVNKEDFEKATQVLLSIGYNEYESSSVTKGFVKHKGHIELHCDADVATSFFDNLFYFCESENEYTFRMSKEYKLLFVICHMIKHIKCYGAGIKMLMDVDAIITKDDDFDENKFFALCAKAGCEKAARIILSLSAYWLGTDVKSTTDFTSVDGKKLLKLFEQFMIDSGNFGLDNASIGGVYLGKNATKGKKVNFLTSLKAFFTFLFPNKEILYNRYSYAKRHHILLSAAWCARLFEGLFCRGGRTLQTAGEIFTVTDIKNTQNELITALDI